MAGYDRVELVAPGGRAPPEEVSPSMLGGIDRKGVEALAVVGGVALVLGLGAWLLWRRGSGTVAGEINNSTPIAPPPTKRAR